VRENKLVTVCEEAGCPNIGECWEKKHATFMIMGRHLHAGLRLLQREDRAARRPRPDEPESVADAVAKLGLAHVVHHLRRPGRLADGGAQPFRGRDPRIRGRSPGPRSRS
jgi:lipoic acid synthetase